MKSDGRRMNPRGTHLDLLQHQRLPGNQGYVQGLSCQIDGRGSLSVEKRPSEIRVIYVGNHACVYKLVFLIVRGYSQ